MIINRVSLENYRCHENKDVDFTTGVNLLLGENGSGKSSILEALGFALFNADLRTNTQKDAIRKGASHAKIVVDFTGTDGNSYSVSRQIGRSQHHRLYVAGEKNARLDSKQEVLSKIRELTGITGNEKNIYQNVITAAQNKLVEVFTHSSTDREKNFNQIFNTGIYRKMYDLHLKSVLDRYTGSLKLKEQEIKTLSEQLKNPEQLEADLKTSKKEHKKRSGEISAIKKEINAGKKETTALEKQSIRINGLRDKLNSSAKLISRSGETLKSAEDSVAKAKNAAGVAEKNRDEHNEYQACSEEFNRAGEQLTGLETAEKKLLQLKENAAVLENRITASEKDLESGTNKKKDRESMLLQQRKKTETEKKKRIVILADLVTAEENLKTNRNLEEELKTLMEELETREKEIRGLSKLIENNNASIDTEQSLGVILDTFKPQLKALGSERDNLDQTSRKISAIEAGLGELEKNREALEDGMCPFLGENCLNMEKRSTPAAYFSERRQQLENQLKEEESEFTKTGKKINKLEEAEQEYRKTELELQRLNELKKETSLLMKKQKLEDGQKKLTLDKIHQALTGTPFLNTARDCGEKEAFLLLQKETEKKLAIREGLEKESGNASAQLQEALDEEQRLEGELASITASIKTAEDEQKKLQQKLKELRGNRILLEKEIEPLPELRKLRRDLEERMLQLKKAHELYTENSALAAELNEHEARRDKLQIELSNFQNEFNTMQQKLNTEEEAFDGEKLREMKERLQEIESSHERMILEERDTLNRIQTIENTIQENLTLQETINGCELEKNRLKTRQEMTASFRNRIRDMGKHVAARFLEEIEKNATSNFRKITGRGEHIRWVNNDSEAYAPYLCTEGGMENASPFSILSGGEQVAVALSLRAAMASFFSAGNFAIFDEPTINLDIQRRAALAENLGQLLKDLDQAIIVTHDDTFREMAQKVISF